MWSHTQRDASQHSEGDMPPIQQGLKCHLLPHSWTKAPDIQLLRLLALLERIHRHSSPSCLTKTVTSPIQAAGAGLLFQLLTMSNRCWQCCQIGQKGQYSELRQDSLIFLRGTKEKIKLIKKILQGRSAYSWSSHQDYGCGVSEKLMMTSKESGCQDDRTEGGVSQSCMHCSL